MGPGPAALGQRGGGGDGALELRPPDAEFRKHRLGLRTRLAFPADDALGWADRWSWLSRLLTAKRWRQNRAALHWARIHEAFGILSRRPGYEWLAGEQPEMIVNHEAALAKEALSPAYEEAVAYTGFALDEFKARTERDGAALAVLATHHMGQPGDRIFDRLHDLAAARGIPVISQRAWIERRGEDVWDARWPHDMHWTPTGHRWAAEVLLEWLTHNQDVCHRAAATS